MLGLGSYTNTADGTNPASTYICIYVLYYQNSYTFGVKGLYKAMQDFYHQQELICVDLNKYQDHIGAHLR